MTLVGYIPARSGSKRLKDKNFRDFFQGFSMTEIALKKSKKSKKIKFTLLDTDNEIFLQKMQNKGLTDYCRVRGKKLSQDDSLTKDSLIDCIQKAELDLNINIDSIALLQPSSPLISQNSVDNIINRFLETNVDLITSFTDIPININDCISVKKNYISKINIYNKNSDKILFETGGIYVIKKDRLIQRKEPFCVDSLKNIHMIPLKEFVDVDFHEQFQLAKDIFKF